MKKLKVGVCEAAPEMEPCSEDWERLARSVREAELDVFLMNEMPFGRWISAGDTFDPGAWQHACKIHDEGGVRLHELEARLVLGSRPRQLDGLRVNEAFIWTSEKGYRGIHTKQYFPDEPGYYEARWFQSGERHFRAADAGFVRLGFLICTEVMFNEHARRYGRNGAQVIAVPRAVGKSSLARWLVAMKMAAVVSGCYVLTSNRGGVDSKGQEFGGCGWIVDPNGELMDETSPASPVVTYTIDLDFVAVAQSEYPCYVKEPENS